MRYTILIDVRRDEPLRVWECEDVAQSLRTIPGFRWLTWSRTADHAVGRNPSQYTYTRFRITARVKAETPGEAQATGDAALAAVVAHPLAVEARLTSVSTTLPTRGRG